jgi:predicted 2-oxoglutarate/Fe(II)-dependent dioxygenase YbiX
MEWYDLPRIEKTSSRVESKKIDDNILVENLDYGINLYRNAISQEDCQRVITMLEEEISLGKNGIQWHGAKVNGKERTTHARNCYDLKFKKDQLGKYISDSDVLKECYDIVDVGLNKSLRHYESVWNFTINYKEAFNFVKYLPGEFFKIHADHGPYYTCTVSAVVYLNDDYEGGEIEFPRHNLTLKPKAGDIILSPSNFVYEHASLNVSSGTKYSVVVMMDYNDLYHKEETGETY